MDFDDIRQQHANIRRKIARCKASGDLKRLLGLRDQLEWVRQNIGEIKVEVRPIRPVRVLRKSYSYEFFLEGLLIGPGSISECERKRA